MFYQRTLLKDLLRLFDRNRALLEGDHDHSPAGKTSSGPSHAVSFALPPSAAAYASAPAPAPSAAPTAAAATRRSSIVPRFSDSVSRGVQADGKDDFSAVLDTDLHTAAAVNMLGVAPLAPTLLRIRGDDQPFQVTDRSFWRPSRSILSAWHWHLPTGAPRHAVLSEGAAYPARRMGLQPNHGHLSRYGHHIIQMIMTYVGHGIDCPSLCPDKIYVDLEMERKGMSKQPLAEFTHAYFTKTAGLAACADVLTSQLFKACETQIGLPRIAVFAAQVGLA